MSARQWLFNIDDPEADGMLQSRGSNTSLGATQFFRHATEIVTLYPVKTTTGGPPYSQLDLSNLDTVRVGVGLKDEPPTSGTWALTANGTGTGMSALTYNQSAASLQTLLNAILGANAVAVTLANAVYTIVVQATNTSVTFASATNVLYPASAVDIQNPVPAAVGVQAIYTIQLIQQPYAYTATWTLEDPNAAIGTLSSVDSGADTITVSASVTEGDRIRFGTSGTLPGGLLTGTDFYPLSTGTTVQVSRWPGGPAFDITAAGGSGTNTVYHHDDGITLTVTDGSSTAPAIATVAIDPPPLSGAFRFLYQQRQTALVTCQANTAVAAVWKVQSIDPNGNWNSNYIDLPDTSNATVRMWFNINSTGTPPATPGGGSLLEIDVPAGTVDTIQFLALATDGLNSLTGEFTATLVGGYMVVTSGAGGERVDLSTNITGVTLTTTTQGTVGQLVGKAFVLNDGLTSTVGVYITGGTITTVPALASVQTRTLAINLSGGESASAAATAIAAGLAGDPSFTPSTATSNIVSAINTDAGARGTAIDVSAGYFSTAISKDGFIVVATVDAESDAGSFEAQLGDAWTVTKTTDYNWTLTRTALGSIDYPTADEGNLSFPLGINITLGFSSLSLSEAFANNGGADITATREIKAANVGEDEVIWLQDSVTLTTDLLSGATTAGPIFEGTIFGLSDVGIGDTSVAVTFSHAFSTVPELFPGAIRKLSPSDGDPPLIMGTQSVTAAGGTVLLSGAATDAAKLPWFACII